VPVFEGQIALESSCDEVQLLEWRGS